MSQQNTEYELHLSIKIYNLYFQQIYPTSNLCLYNINIFYQILT